MDVVSPFLHDIASDMRVAAKAGHRHPGTFEFSPMLRPNTVLEASIGLLKHHGSSAGAVITLRDISARRLSEDRLSPKFVTGHLTGQPGDERTAA